MRITPTYITERYRNTDVQLAIFAQLLLFSDNTDLVQYITNHPLCAAQSIYRGVYQLANTVCSTEKRKFLNFILSLPQDDKQLLNNHVEFLYCHLLAKTAVSLIDLKERKPLTYEKWQVLAKMFNVKKQLLDLKITANCA